MTYVIVNFYIPTTQGKNLCYCYFLNTILGKNLCYC